VSVARARLQGRLFNGIAGAGIGGILGGMFDGGGGDS
jgi:hypothetical protein